MDKSKLAELEQQAGEIRPDDFRWWKPEKGDSLTGTIEFIGEKPGKSGKYGPEDIIKIRDARDAVFAKKLTASLKRAVVEQNLATGDTVTVKFFGEVEIGGDKTFLNFKVVVHEKAAGDNFNF